MKTRRPYSRTAALAVLLASSLPAAFACKKSADTIPAGDGASADGAPAAGAVEVVYKPGAYKLKQDGKLTFKSSEPDGVSEVTLDLSGTLDVSDAGAGKLKVAYTVGEVRKVEVSKNILESFKEGPPDLPALLKATTGAQVVDLHGETDDAATKALPENSAKKPQGPAAAVEAFVGGLLELPSQLPPKPLVEGTPLKITERKKKPTPFGIALDMDITSTYTLVKVDASSGKRVAEIKIESEQSGAHEDKGALLSIDVAAEGVLRFNLDDQLPVGLTLRATQNINVSAQGREISVEIRTDVDSTYSPV